MGVLKNCAYRTLAVFILLIIGSPALCGEDMVGPRKFWEVYAGGEVFTSGRASGSVSGWVNEEHQWSSSGRANYSPSATFGIRYSAWTSGEGGVFLDIGTLNAEADNAEFKALTFSAGLAQSLATREEGPGRAGFAPSIGAGVLFGLGNLRVQDEESYKSVSSLGMLFGAEIFLEAAYLFPSGKGIALRYRIMPAIASFNDESIASEKASTSFLAHALTIGYVF